MPPIMLGRTAHMISAKKRQHHPKGRCCITVEKWKVARLTGLEPATPGVTGRYSNQLSYNRAMGAE